MTMRSRVGQGWGGVDRSLLALHLVRAELCSLSPLPHGHTNPGTRAAAVHLNPGKHSRAAQAHDKNRISSTEILIPWRSPK